MSDCINLNVTKQTTTEEIVHFLLTDSQYHTFTIGGDVWSFSTNCGGFGNLISCPPQELGDWYYDSRTECMRHIAYGFDCEVEEPYAAMIGNPWHTYCELAEEIVNCAQTN